jgi:hypothetical protein
MKSRSNAMTGNQTFSQKKKQIYQPKAAKDSTISSLVFEVN